MSVADEYYWSKCGHMGMDLSTKTQLMVVAQIQKEVHLDIQ